MDDGPWSRWRLFRWSLPLWSRFSKRFLIGQGGGGVAKAMAMAMETGMGMGMGGHHVTARFSRFFTIFTKICSISAEAFCCSRLLAFSHTEKCGA